MTATQMSATERALLERITIIAKGSIKSNGARFFLVNGSHGSQYVVLVHRDRLECNCLAGQHGKVCKHRAAVHAALVAERPAHETAVLMPARDNQPVSMWK